MFKAYKNNIRAKKIIRDLFNKLEGEDVILPTSIYFCDYTVRLSYLDLIFIDINTHYKEGNLDIEHTSLHNNDFTKKEINFIFEVMLFYNKYKKDIIKIISEEV